LPRIGTITVPAAAENIDDYQYALDTSTWGSPRVPKADDASAPRAGDVILIGTGYSRPDGSKQPRVDKEVYRQGKFDQIIVIQVTGAPAESAAPHWPQEVIDNKVKYPFRFPISILGEIHDLQLSTVPEKLATNFHRSINGQSRAVVGVLDEAEADGIAKAAGHTSWKELVSHVPEYDIDPALVPRKKKLVISGKRTSSSTGQGMQPDPDRRLAVERFSVDVAMDYYRNRGWTVRELQKPFDLNCTRGSESLHVEVKGTAGMPGTVNLTPNEVDHAWKHRTDLFIVYDIRLQDNPDEGPDAPRYIGTFGVPVLIPGWRPDKSDISVRSLTYRVPWDQAEDLIDDASRTSAQS